MYHQSLLYLVVLLLSYACTTAKLVPHAGTTIEQLGICVDYDPTVPLEAQILFDQQLNDFIARYNSQSRTFQLQPCADPEVASLRLYISDTRLVNSGEQTAGIALSTLGLALPFLIGAPAVPFYAGFYYFPKNISRVEVSLSDDISAQQDRWIKRIFFNSGFLMTMEKQLHKHSRHYGYFLNHLFTDLERSYMKTLKQEERQQLLTKSTRVIPHSSK